MSKRKNVSIGQRYGMLTVVKLIPERDRFGYRHFECKCDCGGTKNVRSVNLNHGQTRSCGCLLSKTAVQAGKRLGGHNRKPFGESSFTYLYHQYKTAARCRLTAFTLTKAAFKAKVTQNCYYCGSPPLQSILRKTPSGLTANGAFVYNGLDRVDPSEGYTEENTRPCCKHCNVAKSTQTELQFKNWLIQTYTYWASRA